MEKNTLSKLLNDHEACIYGETLIRKDIHDALRKKWLTSGTLTEAKATEFALSLPITDLDASRYLKRILGNRFKYIPTSKTAGQWYYWDGTIWAEEPSGKLARKIVDAFTDAVADYLGDLQGSLPEKSAPISAEAPKATKSESELAIATVRKYIHLLKGETFSNGLRSRVTHAFDAGATYFDNDRGLAVFADGQVLDTNNPSAPLKPADPSRPVSRKMGVTLGEGEPKRLLQAFANWEIPADQIQYLKIAAGAAFLGRGDAKNIVAMVGLSNTGKSTFIRTLHKAFGTYGVNLPAGAIVDRGSTNFDQYKARGARFLFLEEPYEAKTDDSFFKNLAGGGETVSTQQKGKDAVTWNPQCVLFIGANHVPKINTQDIGIVTRLNILGFNRVFKKDDGVFMKDLDAFLIKEEGPKIARWILEGAIEYHRLGVIPVPASIEANATSNTTNGSISLRWLTEQFEEGTFVDVKGQDVFHHNMLPETKELYAIFTQWCDDNGEKPPRKLAWANEINNFQGQPKINDRKRSKGYTRLWGVVLKGSTVTELTMTVTENGVIVT